MGKADLHIHSTYSDGYETVADILDYVEHHTQLDVIAITDHDSIDGGLKARDLATHTKYRADVIVGAEISTRDGHLLALNIERLIRKGQSMADTIQAVHEQGGLAIVAHPLSQWCPSASLDTLLALGDHAPDALEVHNASFAGIGSNSRVRVVNTLRFGWATTGSSDAHNLDAIGSGFTIFLGSTAENLIGAIQHRATLATGGYWSTVALAGYGYRMLRDNLPIPRLGLQG